MNLTPSKNAVAAVALAVFATLSLCRATPLQRTDVPADPMWLLHLDFHRLRPTTVGQYLMTELEKPEAQSKLASFQAMFKFDLKTQLHALTLYGMSDAEDKAVLMVYADFDADHLATLARGAQEYQSSGHKQHVIHSWLDATRKGKSGSPARTYAAARDSRVLIFGQTESAVAKALEVMDLSASNLTASKVFPALDNGSAFFQAAAQHLKLRDSDPNAAVFRLAKSLSLQVSENQNRVNAILQLSAGDEDVAHQIVSIGQGLISLIKLQRDRPEATKFADALTLTQDSSEVKVTLSLPAPDAVEIMKADAARKARKSEKSE
jgi:hypothetical protein